MNTYYEYPKKVVIKDKHCGKCEIKKEINEDYEDEIDETQRKIRKKFTEDKE